MNPLVRDEMLKLASEIGRRYAGYPAVKGVTWMRLPEYPSVLAVSDKGSPLDTGYGDETIALYRKETNSRLPDWGTDAARFGRRQQWLLSHEREQWLAWRCRKVWELDRDIDAVLAGYRKDWRYWHIAYRPLPALIKAWGNRSVDMRDVYRYGGIDPQLYDNHNERPATHGGHGCGRPRQVRP